MNVRIHDCYDIELKSEPNNCPTKVYNWIKIIKQDNLLYVHLDKRVIDLNNYTNLKYKLFKFKLPPSSSENDTLLSEIICIYDTRYSNSEKFFKLKVIQTNNTHKSNVDGGKDGEIDIDINEFEENKVWYDFQRRNENFNIEVFTYPPLYKKKQSKLQSSKSTCKINYPFYFQKKINVKSEKKIFNENIYFYPLIPVLDHEVILNVSVDDTFISNNKTKIEILDDFKKIVIQKDTPLNSSFNYLIDDIKNYIKFQLKDIGEDSVRLKIESRSSNLDFNNLTMYIIINFNLLRFRLNYSSSSFQTCLDPSNYKVIKNMNEVDNWNSIYDDKKPYTLGMNFNTIIMNKDSDWEYLITEILPYAYKQNNKFQYNIIKQPIKIKITSSNENVIKSFVKFIIPINTTRFLRLQRYGDPRDYLTNSCLIKLKCIGIGISILSFEIESTDEHINNLTLNKIILCSVGLSIDKKHILLNSSTKERIKFTLKPLCDDSYPHIANEIFDQSNYVIQNLKQKTINKYDLHYKLMNDYLMDDIMMKPETDIKWSNESLTNINAEIHTSVLNFSDKSKVEMINPKNMDSFNKFLEFDVVGLSEGKVDLILLVNSKITIPKYYRHFSTFTNKPLSFISIKNEIKTFKNFLWPSEQIQLSNFVYKNGYNSVDKTYNYISNGGPEVLFCETLGEYGWTKENIYERKNIYDTKRNTINGIEKFITANLDDINNNSCVLFYGKKINGIFDKNYWANKNINLDFCIRSKSRQEKISNRINTMRNTDVEKTNIQIGNVLKTPSNKITKMHTRNEKLYIYCEGDKLVETINDIGYIKNNNNNIKELVNGKYLYKDIKLEFSNDKELKIYENVIFSVDSDTDIQFDWGNIGDTYNYLLIITSTKNIQDIDIENIEGKWEWDDTLIKNTNFQRDLNILKSSRQTGKHQYNINKNKFINKQNGFEFNFKNVKINFSDDRASYFVLNIESKLVSIDVDINNIEEFITNHKKLYNEIDTLNVQYTSAINVYLSDFDNWKLTPREALNSDIKNKFDKQKMVIEQKEKTFIDDNEQLDEKIRDLMRLIEEVKEEKKIYFENLEKEQELLKKPIIIKGGEEYNWVNGENISLTNENNNYKWFKAEERYTIELTTKVNQNGKLETYSYKTNQNEIKDVDDYIKNIIVNNNINRLLLDKKNILKKIDTQSINKFSNKENALLNTLQLEKLRLNLIDVNNSINREETRGNGGLYYIKKINEKWVYFWKEWDIKYYIKAIKSENFNEIIKYQILNTGNNNIKKILLYCSGRKNLKSPPPTVLDKLYDIENKIIELKYFNNYYDIITQFRVEKIEEYGFDNYILQLTPVSKINRLINYEVYENKIPYWKELIIIEEEEEEVKNNAGHKMSNDGRECIKIDIKIDKTETDVSIKKTNNIRKVSSTKEICWAKTINGQITFVNGVDKNSIFTSEQGDLEIYSKISENEDKKKSNIDNYYKYSYFETMPVSKTNDSTFSIYTGGGSNSKLNHNMYPTKEFWHASKVPSIKLNIVNLEIPIIIRLELKSRLKGKGIELIWTTAKENVNKLYVFEVQKYDAYAPFPVWKTIVETKETTIFDTDVEEFNTYFYKVRSTLIVENTKMVSPYSSSKEVFVCRDSRFLNGRFNNSIKNLNKFPHLKNQCKGKGKAISIFNTDYKLTKKQLFSILAKKKGGGLLR